MTGVKVFWFFTLLTACAAAVLLIGSIALAGSAPQQAAGAAMAIGIALIPYVFTRAVEGLATTYPTQVQIAAPKTAPSPDEKGAEEAVNVDAGF